MSKEGDNWHKKHYKTTTHYVHMNPSLVYMVAGLSSRFGGKIKQFACVGPHNETLIEYSLKQALASKFSKIIFIVGEKTEKPFKEMFKDNYQGIPVYYARQEFNPETRDKPWGTVDALCTAEKFITEPCIVCNGDDLYGEESFKILTGHLQKNPSENATLGFLLKNVLPEQGKVNRGIFQQENNYVTEITETFDIERLYLEEKNLREDSLASMNIFALTPKTIQKLATRLKLFKETHAQDRKSECLLPHELSELIKQKEITMKLYPTASHWLGITNPEDEDIVRKILLKH
jgi:NDP-sugar pyrophosphorylase family protein